MEAKNDKLVPTAEFKEFLDSSSTTSRVGDHYLLRAPVPDFNGVDYGSRFEILVDMQASFADVSSFSSFFFTGFSSMMGARTIALRDIEAECYYHPHRVSQDLWQTEELLTPEDFENERLLLEKVKQRVSASVKERLADPSWAQKAQDASHLPGYIKDDLELSMLRYYVEHGNFDDDVDARMPVVRIENWPFAIMDYLIDADAAIQKYANAHWNAKLREIGRAIKYENLWQEGVRRLGNAAKKRAEENRSIRVAIANSGASRVRFVFDSGDGSEAYFPISSKNLCEFLVTRFPLVIRESEMGREVPAWLRYSLFEDSEPLSNPWADMSKLKSIRYSGRDLWSKDAAHTL